MERGVSMNAKKKKMYLIVISVLAVILSALSSSFAYSFLGATGWTFAGRFWAGLALMVTPVLVLLLVIELFGKESRNQ